jgi:hypothetical protein
MADEPVDDDEPQLADAEIDDEDLDDDLDEDVIDDDLETLDLGDEVAVDAPLDAIVDPDAEAPAAAVPATKSDDDEEDGLDLDEESHPDDVEVPLDALLKERTASAKLEDEEEDLEDEEPDADPGEGPTKIMPRRPGEFLCTSCFLVLPRNQLADEARMLCRDCV